MAGSRAPAAVAPASLLLAVALALALASTATVWAGRAARNVPLLVFPNGGTFKFVVGVTTPVKLPNRTMVMQLQFQWLYSELTNISQAEQDLTFTVGRAAAYSAATSLMDSLGVDGHACLLRAVCEAAETPLLHDGLLGELAHLLLTPGNQEPQLRQHREARDLGRGGGDVEGGGVGGGGGCLQRYGACRPGHGLLDAFSRLLTA